MADYDIAFYVFGGVGLLVIFYQFLKCLKIFFYTRLRCPHNLIQRYGQGSYAVITGGSDGMGKCFAFELVRRGFNIVLIARNPAKLQAVADELKAVSLNRSADIRIISKDFTRA